MNPMQTPAPSPPILWGMPTQLDNALATAQLTAAERRVLELFVARLGEELGDDLRAVWLYGSRARGDGVIDPSDVDRHSDVDLLVIAEGSRERNQNAALDLSGQLAEAEDESPFTYSVHVYDSEWLRGRREIESFFIQEVDRDKIVLAGGVL